MTTGVACPPPIIQFFDNSGAPAAGGTIYTTVGGLNATVYMDVGLTLPFPNPIQLNSRGEPSGPSGSSAQIFLTPNTAYTFTLFDANNNQINQATYVDGVQTVLTQASVGAIIWPILASETTAGITPFFSFAYTDMQRYLIANDSTQATFNTSQMVLLCSPLTQGPVGQFYFTNITGADTYYFNAQWDIRNGMRFDLCESTLQFTKNLSAADNVRGFMNFMTDVTIENGTINVSTSGTGFTNAGMAIRIGSRPGYPFGQWPAGVYDQDNLVAAGLPLMGNITLRNLYFTSNNDKSNAISMILALGGIRDLIHENIHYDGQGLVPTGFYYEFGFASANSNPGTEALWTSSHGTNLRFLNTHCQHLNTSVIEGYGIELVGSHHAVVDGLTVDHAYGAFLYQPGEALFYRPWVPTDLEGGKRGCTTRNVTGSNLVGTGLSLGGAASASGGYLSGAGLTAWQQCDLMDFTVENCSVAAASVGANISGDCTIDGLYCNGSATGNAQLIIADDVRKFSINRAVLVNCIGGSGLRLFFTSVSGVTRLKSGTITNSLIAGNTGGIGISVANTLALVSSNNQIGYSMAYDGVAETVQTIGINVSQTSNGGGVVSDSDFISTASGTAYSMLGTITNACVIRNPQGETGTSGTWEINGVPTVTGTVLATKTVYPNSCDKYAGKQAYNSTTNKLFVAQGGANTSAWISVDGATTVNPA